MSFSIEDLAARQLADLKALSPGTYFGAPHTPLSIQDAYDVQDRVTALRVADGDRIAGYKLGCLGPTIEKMFGMVGPIRGTLFQNQLRRSGAVLSSKQFANLAIEGEMAVRIGLDGNPSSAFPVIELHHLVMRCEPPSMTELIANNGINAGAVLPEREDIATAPSATLGIELNHDTLDNVPLWGFPGGSEEALAWLRGNLSEAGIQLEPGQLVLTGTLSGLFPVKAGDQIRVAVDDSSEVAATVAD